jgi:hypothetical protein
MHSARSFFEYLQMRTIYSKQMCCPLLIGVRLLTGTPRCPSTISLSQFGRVEAPAFQAAALASSLVGGPKVFVGRERKGSSEWRGANASQDKGRGIGNIFQRKAREWSGGFSRKSAASSRNPEALAFRRGSIHYVILAWGTPGNLQTALARLDKPESLIKPRASYAANDGRANTMAYSTDGKLVAVGYVSGDLVLWDSQTGKQVRSFDLDQEIMSVTFSNDGKWMAASTGKYQDNKPGSVKVWDTKTWEEA